ncbi:cytochrome c oxidase accessory protein FixG [Chitinivorax tropicus]|uniref:Cytochrome c oxidase accessory protein FixG n=1 Tax=Chitinivorax tropicus TaxID=714531 RepID=A0A840MVM9_9PROT|nr:cytochrome c oxidase accessory protein CcoG [Chitinivorax tropicus]MBB5020386.1 cytochrome c oxidase accessory protein FixG [Chitinivorax tropicus]
MGDRLKNIPIKVVSTEQQKAEEVIELYEVRKKIHPRWVSGLFNNWRVAMVIITQLFFYGVPWLSWNDRQAMLFDLANRKFYVFGVVFWPQDFVLLAGLLTLCAFALFWWTTIAGRLWCGYACPQTVYTELFLWIEHWIEGDHVKRRKLDDSPMSLEKLGRRGGKHLIWIALALWTGFTFVGFFTPIRLLWSEVWHWTLGSWEAFWIGFYAFATYGNAGFMREQVCKYMCPYARFQSAMFDQDTLVISYDATRGEPRGSRSKKSDHKAEGLGDCINCGICVQVCPTGIDIRNGLQYECIGCAACIDACDQVMDKMNYPRGLIRYTTENAMEGKYPDKDFWKRLKRPRVVMYTLAILIVAIAMVVTLALRKPIKLNVIRDRTTMVRQTDDDKLENLYQLQLINTSESPRRYQISATGIPTLKLIGDQQVEVPAASTYSVPVSVQIDKAQASIGSKTVTFRVQATDDASVAVEHQSSFITGQ